MSLPPQFCPPHSLSVSQSVFLAFPHKTYKSYKSKRTGKEGALSRLQISYLSHLDICQFSNSQPRFGEELLECDTACGLEFQEAISKKV